MKLLLIALVAFVLVSCVPAFEPVEGAAPGVTLTMTEHEGYTTFRVDADPALDRLFLRFTGSGLAANAPGECEVVDGALECIIGAIDSWFEVSVAGTTTNDWSLPAGIACREECYALYLSE